MKFSRRSFLKGLAALSFIAAVPAELVDAAKKAYSDATLLSKPPAYILIDGQIVPFYSLTISEPMGGVTYYTNKGIVGIKNLISPPELPIIELDILGDELARFLSQLKYFNFEIFYDKIPYTIKGEGYGKNLDVDYFCLSSEAQPDITRFYFDAKLEEYNSKCL